MLSESDTSSQRGAWRGLGGRRSYSSHWHSRQGQFSSASSCLAFGVAHVGMSLQGSAGGRRATGCTKVVEAAVSPDDATWASKRPAAMGALGALSSPSAISPEDDCERADMSSEADGARGVAFLLSIGDGLPWISAAAAKPAAVSIGGVRRRSIRSREGEGTGGGTGVVTCSALCQVVKG